MKKAGAEERQKDLAPLNKDGGFQLILRDRYLMLIALLTILLNIVSLSGDFIFGKLLVDHTNEVIGTAGILMKARKAFIGQFYASYYEWTNIVSFIIQAFLVSRIFKRIGIPKSLFILPSISLATFTLIIISPILQVVRALKIAENSTNYSLQNTVRNALFFFLRRARPSTKPRQRSRHFVGDSETCFRPASFSWVLGCIFQCVYSQR